jgi:DNA polymerase-3 subunit beta
MKFSCTKDNLLETLNLVAGVAGKHVNLPILSNILIKADQQKVECSTTNLELALTVTLRAKVEVPGTFTVPARTFADIAALLRDEKVDIELKDQELIVVSGKSSTKIKGTPAEEFPIIPQVEQGKEFSLSVRELKHGLSQVSPAVARNDIRPELAGVFFGFNLPNRPGLVMAATDSYRLAEKVVAVQGNTEMLKVILPGKTVQELSRMLVQAKEESIKLMVAENQILIHMDSVQLMSRLVAGVYPDYTQIIPREFTTTVTVPTDLLRKEIKAAGLFTTTGVNAVTLETKPEAHSVVISSASTQTGEYLSEVPAEVTGEAVSVLLSHRYLLDGLTTIDTDQMVFKIVNGDSPCVVAPEGDASFIYIVMPIRQ